MKMTKNITKIKLSWENDNGEDSCDTENQKSNPDKKN